MSKPQRDGNTVYHRDVRWLGVTTCIGMSYTKALKQFNSNHPCDKVDARDGLGVSDHTSSSSSSFLSIHKRYVPTTSLA